MDAADDKKADEASITTFLFPRPPSLIGRLACIQAVSQLVMLEVELWTGRAGPGRHSNFLQRAGPNIRTGRAGPGGKIQARPIIGKQVATKNKRIKLRIVDFNYEIMMRLEF